MAVRYAHFDAPIRAAHGADQPSAVTGGCLCPGNLRGRNRRNGPRVRGFASRIDRPDSYRLPSHRDVAHGPGAAHPVPDYKAQYPAGGNVGVRLGVPAFDSGAGLGTRCDLAFLCFLLFISGLAAARMVAGGLGDLLRTCISECPACYHACGRSVIEVPKVS